MGTYKTKPVSSVSVCQQTVSLTELPVVYGGRLGKFAQIWNNLTSDPNILGFVSGCHIEFDSLPEQEHPSAELRLPENIKQQMNSEVDSLLTAGVVEKTTPESGEFISPIFPRRKKDGSLRVIINLKKLNPFVTSAHFKMDNKNMAARLMTQNCYMASVDLRQAYYMIPMAAEHRKFLKFHWNNELLQFTALPNGLACAPRQFTKLMKPVFAKFPQEGHSCLGYIDDSFIVGLDKISCESAVQRLVQIQCLKLMVAQSPLTNKNWAGPVKFDPGQVKIIIDYIRREIFLTFLGDLRKFFSLKHCKSFRNWGSSYTLSNQFCPQCSASLSLVSSLIQ